MTQARPSSALVRAVHNDPHGDTVLAQISPAEAALLKKRGGAGTINPRTGLPQYFGHEGGHDDNSAGPGGRGTGNQGGNPGGGRNQSAGAAGTNALTRTSTTGQLAGTAALASPQAQVNRQFGTKAEQTARAQASAAENNGQGGSHPGPGPAGFGGGLTETSPENSTKLLNRADDASTPVGRPEYDNPTAGQVFSALGIAADVFTGSPLTAAASAASEDPYGRTLLGQSIDSATGAVAGLPDRYSSYPEGRESDSRGDDTRLTDASAPTGDSAGDAGPSAAGTNYLFSDVALQDRRKPRSTLAGTNMLLGAA